MVTNQFLPIGATNTHISELKPFAPTGEDLYYGDIIIQTLGNNGKAVAKYTYDPDSGTNGAWVDTTNGDAIAAKSFEAGEGMWIDGYNGYSVTFPAPEL